MKNLILLATVLLFIVSCDMRYMDRPWWDIDHDYFGPKNEQLIVNYVLRKIKYQSIKVPIHPQVAMDQGYGDCALRAMIALAIIYDEMGLRRPPWQVGHGASCLNVRGKC